MSSSEDQNEDKKCLGEPLVPASPIDALLPATAALNHGNEDVSEATSDVVCEEMPVAFHLDVGYDQIAEIKIIQDSHSSTVETSVLYSEAVGAAGGSIDDLYDDHGCTFLDAAGVLPMWIDAAVDAQTTVDDACQVNHFLTHVSEPHVISQGPAGVVCDAPTATSAVCFNVLSKSTKAHVTSADATEAARSLGTDHSNTFRAAIETEATPEDATYDARLARVSDPSIFYAVVGRLNVPSDDAQRALDVIDKFCQGILSDPEIQPPRSLEVIDVVLNVRSAVIEFYRVLITTAGTTPNLFHTAHLTLTTVINIYPAVFTAVKCEAAPLSVAKAALSVLNAIANLYERVFTALTEAKADRTSASDVARSAINYVATIYNKVFPLAIAAQIAPSRTSMLAVFGHTILAVVCEKILTDVCVTTASAHAAADADTATIAAHGVNHPFEQIKAALLAIFFCDARIAAMFAVFGINAENATTPPPNI